MHAVAIADIVVASLIILAMVVNESEIRLPSLTIIALLMASGVMMLK